MANNKRGTRDRLAAQDSNTRERKARQEAERKRKKIQWNEDGRFVPGRSKKKGWEPEYIPIWYTEDEDGTETEWLVIGNLIAAEARKIVELAAAGGDGVRSVSMMRNLFRAMIQDGEDLYDLHLDQDAVDTIEAILDDLLEAAYDHEGN